MKITWFGGSTFRIYVGGKIFVTDADKAPEGVDRHEVRAAADREIDLTDGIIEFDYLDPEEWQRRRPRRVIDAPVEEIAALYTVSGEAVFIDEPEEGPVILAPAGQTAWGHFADEAVVVIYGPPKAAEIGAQSVLVASRPRLVVIAAEGFTDSQLADLAGHAGNSALVVVEPGLAVEA